jgi:ubiquitin C-terminal hydrolase
MILGLKRYTNAGAKVKARIPYDPDLIDFSEWVTWPSLQRECKYKVYAVIDQHGSSRGGHYNMRSRRAQTDTWSLYDDQHHGKAENGECSHDTLMLFLERLS